MIPVSIIVAIAEKNAIGYKNELLCHLPADLKYFKKTTAGHAVIMGKRTWESLPKRPLPGRRNLVISDVPGDRFEGAETVYSIPEALEHCDRDRENFVIGGGMVYRQFMAIAQKLYITHIHHTFEADTFYADIDPALWRVESAEAHQADENNPYPYTFTVYVRR